MRFRKEGGKSEIIRMKEVKKKSANHIYYTHGIKRNQIQVFFITRFANQYVLRFLLEERNKPEHDTLTRNTRRKLTLCSLQLTTKIVKYFRGSGVMFIVYSSF